MTIAADRIEITSPAELAASIPSLLGFAPADSIVAVFLDQNCVIVTMRCDLDQNWADLSEAVIATGHQVGADALVLATYNAHLARPWIRDRMLEMRERIEAAHFAVRDALRIEGNRWRSYLCQDACCPAEGTAIDTGLDRLQVGMAFQQRADVAARYRRRLDEAPSASAVREATRRLAVNAKQRADEAWNALQALCKAPDQLKREKDVARALLQLSCLDVRCRDFVIGMICGSEEHSELIEAFLSAALRAHDETLPRMAGAAAALLAATESSTIPASCLVELAGDDSLAALVGQSIRAAVPPADYAELLRESLTQTVAALDSAEALA